MRSCILLLSLLVAVANAAVTNAADTVWIKNGDRIVGSIQSKTGDHLIVETAYAGRLSIDWIQIATLETSTSITVKIKGAAASTESVLDIADDGYVICKKCTPALIPLADVDALLYRRK
jgi:hypothetical protein